MIHNKDMHNLTSSSKNARISFEEENICPICKSTISPIFISAALNTSNSATIFNHCRSCNNSFISNYNVGRSNQSTSSTDYYSSTLISSEPCRFSKKLFDDNIVNLSPQFDKIYNQALAAEVASLDEIAGLGYRKALEFLIKDFAIHEHSDDEDKIKAMPLSACIKDYIDAPNIKTLATRSAWIGNDEAHYIRKQEDRDVNDMKAFIKATVYFISMILITEDAASMEPK
ncbi:MAG: DUF4145 domain-containing protein [Lachnospiraceae bacterium]|nr:DUF4145 domain-containing protein [Lachnospiraceae bacterium]